MSKRCIFLSLILVLKISPQALRPFNLAFIHNNAVRRVVEDKVMSGAKRSESGGRGGGGGRRKYKLKNTGTNFIVTLY